MEDGAMADITIPIAFLAGIVSFLSPCILPLLPVFLTFLAGTSLPSSQEFTRESRFRVIGASIFFVLGFSLVFSVLGVLLQSVLEAYAYDIRQYIGYVGGALIIGFGFMMMGLIHVDFLEREYKFNVKKSHSMAVTSFLFGAAFAVGWTPCVGAVLGAVLTLAATQPSTAFPLMLAYSFGLGIPFILAGVFISRARGFIQWISPHLPMLNKVFGLVMIILGILIFTGRLVGVVNIISAPFFEWAMGI